MSRKRLKKEVKEMNAAFKEELEELEALEETEKGLEVGWLRNFAKLREYFVNSHEKFYFFSSFEICPPKFLSRFCKYFAKYRKIN
jgi:hypothetical protein